LGLGNEGSTLKTSRAYVAGLGTTGVLIGSFFLLLTVGSTLVAFRGVPGAASNGDLSSIELRQQREAAAQRAAGLRTASNVLGDSADGSRQGGATGDVFGQVASAGRANPTGNIRQGTSGSSGPGALHPNSPGAPLGEKAPTTDPPASSPGSGTGVVATPVDPGALADQGSGSSGDTGSGSGTDSGSGTGTGTGSGTDSGSDTGSTGGSSGSGSTDSGSGSDSGTGSNGGATGTVGDTVEDTTGSAGAAVGTVSPGAGSTVTDTGSAAGGLLDEATSVVGGLTGAAG
jgi:hypothetical protein